MASTYEPITTTTITSATTSFNITSIPSTYTDLVVVIDGPGISGGSSMDANIRFNSDTGSNYSDTRWQNAGSDRSTSATSIRIAAPRSNNRWNTIIHINNYSNSTTYKSLVVRGTISGTDPVEEMYAGTWRSTAAITTINFISGQSRNYEVGTTVTLYGIKAA